MKEARAKTMAEDIAMKLCIPINNVPAIMTILKRYGVYKTDTLQNYTCEGQMDLVEDFPQYLPDNPEADVAGWAFEEKDDESEMDR